jgi:hypothetical protein
MELWKESLNSDGHQFHQYKQNEQSPLVLTELNDKHVAELNPSMESQPSHRDNWISNGNTYINKQ